MSEEIKQKAREELRELFPLEYLRNEIDNFGYASLENWIDDLLSQALQKRDSQIIKMLENTDVQMSVNGDVSKDEIAMAKFIYKAHIKHIIKKIESAIIPPNSINGTLPSETDSAIK